MIAAKPFLHVAMDDFLDMLPEKMVADPDGLIFERSEHEGKRVITVRGGPVPERVMRGTRHAVAAEFCLAMQQGHLFRSFSVSDDALI